MMTDTWALYGKGAAGSLLRVRSLLQYYKRFKETVRGPGLRRFDSPREYDTQQRFFLAYRKGPKTLKLRLS